MFLGRFKSNPKPALLTRVILTPCYKRLQKYMKTLKTKKVFWFIITVSFILRYLLFSICSNYNECLRQKQPET